MRAWSWSLALLALAAPAAAQVDLGTEAQRAAGGRLYAHSCAQCHGDNGDGNGYAAARVLPRPRDFTSGKYKLRTTPSGRLPSDADLARSIRNGLPYTSMPAWPEFDDAQLRDLIYYLKSFSPDFAVPDRYAPAIEIPQAPASTAESVERGRQVYEQQGCAACHGQVGRGDGASAPALQDDWGHPIRPADLTQRWTFRGGPTRRDIFRTFSTGLNGTPMPSYADTLAVEQRWDLVNYIDSLGASDTPGYSNLLIVASTDEELDLARAEALFETAPAARFPLVGQVIQPGRAFHPAASSLEVRAVRNRREIAFLLRWHDMRKDDTGTNGPQLEVPRTEDDEAPAAAAETQGDDFWGTAPGAAAAPAAPPAASGDDFWGSETAAAQPADAGAEFSDAVALQLPVRLPEGNRKPYFIFGDAQSPVDLWFVDLAQPAVVRQFVGRGSAALEPAEGDEFESVAHYDQGEWTCAVKRSLRGRGGVTFGEGQFVPVAFSVWDGLHGERGNKRALSVWFHLYLAPAETVSAVGPMLRAGGLTLGAELLLLWIIRRRFARSAGAAAPYA